MGAGAQADKPPSTARGGNGASPSGLPMRLQVCDGHASLEYDERTGRHEWVSPTQHSVWLYEKCSRVMLPKRQAAVQVCAGFSRPIPASAIADFEARVKQHNGARGKVRH